MTAKKKPMRTAPAKSSVRGETIEDRRKRARRLYKGLVRQYPDAECALTHRNAFELLVATILSAQCTDERVNMVTPELFRRYPTAKKLAAATQEEIETIVRSTGFYRNKAKSLRGMAAAIVERFGGEVPRTMEDLITLPGVARKTANVVLGTAYGLNEGVVVDTHVARLSHRMGLATHKDPAKIERDLMDLFDRKDWTMLAHRMIWHGRRICSARKPDCEHCPLNKDCPKIGVK